MNFEESNQFVERMEKNNKNKKNVLVVLIICAVIVVILFGLIGYIRQKDTEQLKMFVDNEEVKISSTLLIQEKDGSYYMNVRELASMLGYSYQKGEYKNYTEDAQSCYLRTPYEIISMNANSDKITKYILNENQSTATEKENTDSSELKDTSKDLIIVNEETKEQSINIIVDSKNETQEIFSIDNPIQYVNDELYVPFSELAKIFSIGLELSEYHTQLNRIRISSLPMLAPTMMKIANNTGYSEVSNLYENLTAISNNMLVVGDGTRYGVISLEDGKEIISLKYDKIVYKQNTEEFFVTAENSVGIIDREGKTIIKPTEYDSIASLDELNKLYLVDKNGKYGVINREGEVVVYPEYDSIGLENQEQFLNEDIRNFSLLFGECIPVNYDGKVGIIDIDGTERLKCVYDSLGYVKSESTTSQENKEHNDDEEEEDEENDRSSNTSTTNSTNQVINTTQKNNTTVANDYNSVLTIPQSVGVKGIVVNLNGLYGLFDAEVKRLIIPCACSKIYSKTKSGATKYYLEYNEQELDLENYLKENNLVSVSISKQQEENTNKTTTNTVTNEM